MSNIPHKIHYIWFGRNEKPQIVLDCMKSWRKFFPDWEIIEWNEDNYDVNVIAYTKEAYELRKWAFVSDYARIDILNKYGGIYVDVDVEFIRPLPEKFMELDCFTGFEYAGLVSPGLILATKPNNPFLQRMIDVYSQEHFESENKSTYKTINMHFTDSLIQDGLIINNQKQQVDGCTVFPWEYFCGYDTDIMEPCISDKTICWHHYLGSWTTETRKRNLQRRLKKVIGTKNYRNILMAVRYFRKIMKNK